MEKYKTLFSKITGKEFNSWIHSQERTIKSLRYFYYNNMVLTGFYSFLDTLDYDLYIT